ncbi:hypothetical protein ZWY2020_055656 [Hordeum vulgare]|nr:hypothetical protein ZWY2020_055656 [Hordeum vulgare]
MEGAWRKAKRALALRLCVRVPADGDGEDPSPRPAASGAGAGGCRGEAAVTVGSPPDEPVAGAGAAFRRSKSGSRSSSKRKCAICFDSMRSGHGQALFTAECSHKFHFHCISSNVKHGNHVCPVCRAKWKEIPLNRSLSSHIPDGRRGINGVQLPQQDAYVALLHQVPNRQRGVRRLHTSEPTDFNDDEPLQQTEATDSLNSRSKKTAEISTYPEFSSIPQSSTHDGFSVLIHLKAPSASPDQATGRLVNESSVRSPSGRAPVDLVTVIDISGSMAGTKLALLKRAMGFVIQHLGPSDRLSVIAFSSSARRLFHLQRMSHYGRQQALQAINSLGAGGGTNIADALKKATKEMRLNMECVHPGVQLCSIKSGSYPSIMARDGRSCSVDIGHLYADEERDILLSVNIPQCREQTSLLKVACSYRDLTNETIKLQVDEVKINRPTSTISEHVSIEVDRERNRIQAADSIESARSAAERGALAEAVTILEDCRRRLSESFASRSGDRLSLALDAELREMQERMASRQLYEASGRAYMLSGLSSHSWQRATTRGDSTESSTIVHSYQTPSMVQMLQHSQSHIPSPPGQQPHARPPRPSAR